MLKKFFTGFASAMVAVSVIGNTVTVLAEGTEEITDNAEKTEAHLITYDAPEQVERSKTYEVKARPAGSDDSSWQELDVYRVKLMSNGERGAAMTYFDCDTDIEVQVKITGEGDGIDYFADTDEATGKRKGLLAEGTTEEFTTEGTTVNMPVDTRVYPESYGIKPQYEAGGDTINLTVKPGQRVVLDPNGDTRRNLHIWADEPVDIPSVEELQNEGKTVSVVDGGELADSYDTDVVYVKPGYYYKGDGWHNYYVKDNQTWYFEPGAVMTGVLNLDYTTNASVIGRGLIYRPLGSSITINDAVNVHVEGMMGLNHGSYDNGGYFINVANSRNVYVKNLKSIGRNKWGDTMDIFCSEDVTVEGCFYRGNDDCIAIYGPRWNGNYFGDTGNVRNIKVKDCVLMPDLARPIHFGTHGDSSSPNGGRVIDNCRFENIDILTYNKYAYNPRSSGRMPQSIRMDVSEGNTVSNIYFNDIRIQDYMANKICELFITVQGRYGTYTYPGKGINNIYFKDVQYKNIDPTHNGRIEGYKTSDGIDGITQNVTFENLKINGEVALSAEDAQISIGNNTKNIKFVESGKSKYVYRPSSTPEDIWPTHYNYASQEYGAEATAEVSVNDSDPNAAIDNDSSTVWYSEETAAGWYPTYDYTTKTMDGNGITIDTKAQHHIKGVRITWADPSLKHDYRIFVSRDGSDWSAGHNDLHGQGAVNSGSRAEYNKRVKTTWFITQDDPVSEKDLADADKINVQPIIGRYVKIIPCNGSKLDIVKLEVLGEQTP
ncbi:MAG: hypothetical protein Q4G33_10465 [bacterium]|nr:hypothetical protein [bacterium]